MIAGIDAIASDAMIIMDADLQDPPELKLTINNTQTNCKKG